MFMPSMLLFTFILLFSVLLIISSPSWLGAWVGLEVNLISFIPMILGRGGLTSTESSIKYFLVQAFSSLLLLLSILISITLEGGVYLGFTWGSLTLVVALLIKLGAAPFHYWFPAVASGIGWTQNFFLMTLQKFGPLILLNYVLGMPSLMVMLIGLSTFIGSVGGLNQSSLRKLMAYSSINHLGWLLVASYFGTKFMLIYFAVYTFTNLALVVVMNTLGYYYLSQVYYYSNGGVSGLALLVAWLSFGGLPPFIGFFGKWLVISMMLNSGLSGLCVFMVFMSLVSLFYYTRVCYTILSQSGGRPAVYTYNIDTMWSGYFIMVMLVLGLAFVPMFVMIL